MLSTKLLKSKLVKVVILATTKENMPLDPGVADFMHRHQIRHGDTPAGSMTPKQELEEFKSSFFGFLNNTGIDSMYHEFITTEDGFIAVITVAPEDVKSSSTGTT